MISLLACKVLLALNAFDPEQVQRAVPEQEAHNPKKPEPDRRTMEGRLPKVPPACQKGYCCRVFNGQFCSLNVRKKLGKIQERVTRFRRLRKQDSLMECVGHGMLPKINASHRRHGFGKDSLGFWVWEFRV